MRDGDLQSFGVPVEPETDVGGAFHAADTTSTSGFFLDEGYYRMAPHKDSTFRVFVRVKYVMKLPSMPA